MLQRLIKSLVAFALLSVFAPVVHADAADAARGKIIAGVRCTPCHHLDRTSLRVGPGLKGVYGRKPTITGVPFPHWDAAALDAWLQNPRAIKPNTEMVRLPISARDRADVIAYLKAESEEVKTGN